MNYLRLFSLLASDGVNFARIEKSSLSSFISCDYLFLRITYFYDNWIIHRRWRKHFKIWMYKQYIKESTKKFDWRWLKSKGSANRQDSLQYVYCTYIEYVFNRACNYILHTMHTYSLPQPIFIIPFYGGIFDCSCRWFGSAYELL